MIDDSTYISIDVECTGPIPGDYSMISLGAAAYEASGKLLGTFEINLEELPTAGRSRLTMEFWDRNKAAWEHSTKNPVDPMTAMIKFREWLVDFNSPIAVCYPAGFDWTFVTWYFYHFLDYNPLGFSCLDIKSYVAGKQGRPFKLVSKRSMPERWFSNRKHTHCGLDDALEQGDLFNNIINDTIKT